MNGNQARTLAVGDCVVWTQAREPVVGSVVARNQFGVKIEWPDGTTGEVFFNDMQYLERPQRV